MDIFLNSPWKCVVGTHKTHLDEVHLMSTYNICFSGEVGKKLLDTPLIKSIVILYQAMYKLILLCWAPSQSQ